MSTASDPARRPGPAVQPLPAATAAASASGYIDWGVIVAGAVFSAALSFVLLTFGSAIGLSLGSAESGEGVSLAWISIASGIWFIWVMVSAFAAGGYCAGRLRRPVRDAAADEIETRDGAHGLIVWALGILLGAVLAAGGIFSLAGSAASGLGSATSTLAETAGDAITGNLDAIGDGLLRSGGADAATARGVDGSDIGAVLMSAVQGDGLAEQDRAWLVDTLASRTGLEPEAVEAQIDAAYAEAQQAYDAAIDAAETARVAAAIAAFVIAATLMVGAGAAWLGATTGGKHRDDNVPFRTFGR